MLTINRIWPETVEVAQPAPPQPSKLPSPNCSHFARPDAVPATVAHFARRQGLQQATPESSPTVNVLHKGRKRKRSDLESSATLLQSSEPEHATNKRALPRSHSRLPLHIPSAGPSTLAPAQRLGASTPITLQLFIRELLRRSKTHCSTLEVALCYLDGIEESVR